MIHVGVDLHQRFCYMTAVDSRGRLLGAGQVRNQDQALRSYFAQFRGPVQAAVEACSFWPAFRKAVCARVQVRLVHPQRVKAIASAKLKNDRIDSATLAHLLRCDLLPAAWMADEATRELRQQVRMRATLVRQRTRLKNQVHAILHQQGLQFEGSDLFGQGGRAWLKQVSLPAAGGSAVKVYLKLIDEFTAQISTQDEELKRQWKKDARVLWLETIPGIGWYSAVLLVAEIGDILRFQDKRALANYAGLVPWLRESADKRHSGGITRVGSPWLRWIMVEAAHVAVRTSPPVKKWFERLCRRKHKNAALVAVARKLLVAVWAMLHDGVGFEEKHFALN
ncbi:MAG: IS110 family transposase [Acidobacteria bacterium]|nr:MAG: IS110 family transposase [Acidobacteriota bacterium]